MHLWTAILNAKQPTLCNFQGIVDNTNVGAETKGHNTTTAQLLAERVLCYLSPTFPFNARSQLRCFLSFVLKRNTVELSTTHSHSTWCAQSRTRCISGQQESIIGHSQLGPKPTSKPVTKSGATQTVAEMINQDTNLVRHNPWTSSSKMPSGSWRARDVASSYISIR